MKRNYVTDRGADWVIEQLERGKTLSELYRLVTGGLPEETIKSDFHQGAIKTLQMFSGGTLSNEITRG